MNEFGDLDEETMAKAMELAMTMAEVGQAYALQATASMPEDTEPASKFKAQITLLIYQAFEAGAKTALIKAGEVQQKDTPCIN